MKNILIIDCNSLIYPTFHAFGNRLTNNNQPVGVIYGFLYKVLSLANQFDTNRVIFCWDSDTKLLREIEYPAYKESRKKRKKELSVYQLRELKLMRKQSDNLYQTVLPDLGFNNSFKQNGYESDDIMAVIVKILKKQHPIMVTSDNDMYQCLDHCDIFSPSVNKKITKKTFMANYHGVEPDQWAILKSIGGCSGDDVKGIKGVSDPKKPSSKAFKYIKNELGKGVILDRINSEKGQKIIKRNIKLVTLPYPGVEPIIFRKDKITKQRLISVFSRYNFMSFLKPEMLYKWEKRFL